MPGNIDPNAIIQANKINLLFVNLKVRRLGRKRINAVNAARKTCQNKTPKTGYPPDTAIFIAGIVKPQVAPIVINGTNNHDLLFMLVPIVAIAHHCGLERHF
jgi:hypothetical protein